MTTFLALMARCIAVAGVAAGILILPAQAAPKLIKNDTFWRDTNNNPIYSQGGGILKVGATYYWYGVKYEGAVTYAANPVSSNSNTGFNAVTVYSSTDLATWKFEGNAASAGPVGGPWEPGNWIGRLGVVYNKNTQKYVLISQIWSPTLGSGVLFATSNTPVGPFVFDHIQPQITNVVTPATGDQTIYTDDDGASYLIFSNASGRARSYVAQIRASDSLNIEPAVNIALNSAGREGNALFKHNGVYYFCSSELHGWNASQTYCRSANAINGPYTAEFVLDGSQGDFSHVSQNGFFIQVNGSAASTVLYAGDRWSDFAGNGIGYNQWVPLSFNGTTPRFNSMSQFNLDAATGTWTVGAGNNYAINPSFEADRVRQNALAGWSTWTNLTDANPNNNLLRGHTGRWNAEQYHTAAYSASRYQDLTGLPNGTYTLSAWVKSSGGQSIARIYVKDFGGSELVSSINTAIPNWTQVTIPNIQVTNGKATIGMYQVANAGNWINVDDFSFTKN